MAKLVWKEINKDSPRPWFEAEGFDGDLFTAMPSATPGKYRLGRSGSLLDLKFDSADEAKAKAQSIEDDRESSQEDPNNTFRGDFAGFAENH